GLRGYGAQHLSELASGEFARSTGAGDHLRQTLGHVSFLYFVAGPHPRHLCLRGFRRSALLASTFRLVNVTLRAPPPRPVPSRLSPLGIACIDFPLSQRHAGCPTPAACALAAAAARHCLHRLSAQSTSRWMPHPRGLCFRGRHRSAFPSSTSRLLNCTLVP